MKKRNSHKNKLKLCHTGHILLLSSAFCLAFTILVSLQQSRQNELDLIETNCGGSCHMAASRAEERVQHALLAEATARRALLMSSALQVTVSDSTKPAVPAAQWTIRLKDHPELLTLGASWLSAEYVIDTNILAAKISTAAFEGQHSVIIAEGAAVQNDKKVLRLTGTKVARDGYLYDPEDTAKKIARALSKGEANITIDAPYTIGFVTVPTDSDPLTLQLLSTGLSNFSDSTADREWNIFKATNEKLNNVYVPAGEIFSFLDILDVPITLNKGWREGLGLFGGGTAMTAGAGICQVATTVYRAALLAGFPIAEKRNHSMWVDHYEQYGVGLDATVFPKFHDLRFTNDTSAPILIQSFIRDKDVVVNIYGVSDGRTVTLEGPYFNASEKKPDSLKRLAKNQIGWMYHVKSGEKNKTTPLISTYSKGFPRKVVSDYADFRGINVLTETLKKHL